MKQNDSIQKEDLNLTAGIQATAASVDDLTILKNLLEPKKKHPTIRPDESDDGHEVKLKDARECIERFAPTMAAHGITLTGKGPIPEIGKMSRITESEEFRGSNLLEWMVKTARKYDPEGEGKNMGIQLKLGIYTNAFLENYLRDNPELRDKKRDRITIFLVPHYQNDIQEKFNDDDDATAYDLGGLQP